MKKIDRKKVIIIGAGVGGIYAAARLAKQGYQVTVIEKNNQAGGRCNFFEKDGYSFDTGPTLLLMPEIYSRAFSDLEEKIEDHLELFRIDPSYQIFFNDGTKLMLTANQQLLRKQLESIEPNSYEALQRYLKEGESHYKLSLPNLIDHDFKNFFDYFNVKNLLLAFKIKLFINHYKYVSKFFSDQRLKEAFTFQDAYVGLNPYEAPAMFSMLTYVELVNGVWLPKGGMYSFIKAIIKIAEDFGVKFKYNTPVRKVNTKNMKVIGVTLTNNQILDADIFVVNADLTYVYQNLLPNDKMVKSLLRKKYACSTLMFYWGLDKKFSQLKTHNLFVSGNYRQSFKQIIEDLSLPDDPSFYLHTPVEVDPSRAPKGHDSIVIAIPVGHINEDAPQNWTEIKNKAREKVIKRLEAIGIIDIKKHIKFEVSYTAQDWLRLYNLTKGSTAGLSHNLMQLGYLRPKNRHKKYHNLYFIGASTHPGSGVPLVLTSARLTTERILKEFN
jgi:phytoene desaturase